MFIGDPPGNYDRILDFSTALTGTLFFVPSQDFSTTRRILQANRPEARGGFRGSQRRSPYAAALTNRD